MSACTSTISEIAIDAYVYGYPLVLMEYTKRSFLASGQLDALNEFKSAPYLLGPDDRTVVRPNNDTLYTQAFLDLSEEPLVLHVPETLGTYYLMQIMDAWSNTVADPGTRTNGSSAHDFIIVGPGWKGHLPRRMTLIKAPTDMVWVLGRTQVKTDSPPVTTCPPDINYDRAHAIQNGYDLTPLSRWHARRPSLVPVNSRPGSASLSPPDQVARLSGVEFFRTLSMLMRRNPPALADVPALARFALIGLRPGKEFRPPRWAVDAINQAPPLARQRMLDHWNQDLGETVNEWRVLRSGIGTYGTDYLTRGAVAMGGFGANLPVDAIYPSTYRDESGTQLNGANNYVIQLDPVPPVNAFWSVTVYDAAGYLVQNSICRYAIHSTDRAIAGQSAVRLLLQQEEPTDSDQVGYWLPVPAGDFNLVLRMYWPSDSALQGTWGPPPVQRQ